MTDAFKIRRRRSFGSLEAVIIRLRWAYLDQAIVWFPTAHQSAARARAAPRQNI